MHPLRISILWKMADGNESYNAGIQIRSERHDTFNTAFKPLYDDFIYRVVNMRYSVNDMPVELLDGLLSCDFGEYMKSCSQGDIDYVKSLMVVARNELIVDDFRLFIWMRTMNACERDAQVLRVIICL